MYCIDKNYRYFTECDEETLMPRYKVLTLQSLKADKIKKKYVHLFDVA